MKSKLIFFGTISVLLTIAISGCLENEAAVSKSHKDINFESDILQLADSTLDVKEENGEIYLVEATLYFKNIFNEKINVTYIVDFCDKNDNVLYSQSFTIGHFPAGHTFTVPDIFKYAGENVADFNHINIAIKEYHAV